MNNIIKKGYEKYNGMTIVAKATFWFLFCSILQKGISIITIPIFTRLLTTEQYGQFSIYNSWLQIFTIFTTFRLDCSVFNKGMTQFKEDRDGYTSSMQGLTTMLTTITLIIYLIFRHEINDVTELSTFITLAMFVELYLTPAISFWTLRQRYDFKYQSIVLVTLTITLSNAGLGIISVIVSEDKGVARILSCILVQICFGLVLYIYNIMKGKKIFGGKYIKFGIIFNIPLIPHYFSTYILEQSDRIMIQKICGIGEAGIYSVAYNAGMVMMIIISGINNALIPWLYRKLEEKKYNVIGNYLNSIMKMVALVIVIFITFAPEIMKILASEKYYMAVYVIPPVTASVFFIFLFSIFVNVEFFYDANKFTMYLSFIGAGLNVMLNYIFIPIFGYIVAGYTTLCCYIVFTFSHFIFINRLTKKKAGVKIFDAKHITTVSFVIIAFCAILSVLYEYMIIRYIFIFIIILILFFKKSIFMGIFKEMKKR